MFWAELWLAMARNLDMRFSGTTTFLLPPWLPNRAGLVDLKNTNTFPYKLRLFSQKTRPELMDNKIKH